jgi:hypothetical protein
MKNTSILALLVFLVGVLCLTTVSAANYEIIKVSVDDIEVNDSVVQPGDTIYAERGQTLPVEIWFRGTDTGAVVDDVKVKAWLGGYEWNDIEDSTSAFKVMPNVTYHKTLNLKLADDMESSENYALHVEISDKVDNVDNTFPIVLSLESIRHKLNVQDVIFNPGLKVEAGKNLFAKELKT